MGCLMLLTFRWE